MIVMDPFSLHQMSIFIAAVAILYSCVGHGGASGYIAVMMLFGLMPGVMKPTALILNVMVSSIAAFQFYRSGYFRWSLFWPFACASIPFAYLGGFFVLSIATYKTVIGMLLIFAALRLVMPTTVRGNETHYPPILLSLLLGALIGLTSGLIGIGGGILLSPLLILAGWADTKEAAAISAPFILVNSISGLFGFVQTDQSIPAIPLVMLMSAICGGIIGSHLGSRRLPLLAIQRVLSVVLILAGYKMIF